MNIAFLRQLGRVHTNLVLVSPLKLKLFHLQLPGDDCHMRRPPHSLNLLPQSENRLHVVLDLQALVSGLVVYIFKSLFSLPNDISLGTFVHQFSVLLFKSFFDTSQVRQCGVL